MSIGGSRASAAHVAMQSPDGAGSVLRSLQAGGARDGEDEVIVLAPYAARSDLRAPLRTARAVAHAVERVLSRCRRRRAPNPGWPIACEDCQAEPEKGSRLTSAPISVHLA